MTQYNPLLDTQFLLELDKQKEREVYARVIALSFDEQPVETIEGQVTSGSINIDGASAVRRTCSLSLVAKDLNINDFYWGVKSKFKLEVGLKNNIDNRYPNIIWFPQGTYLITTFNTSQSINNYTISISGKDKMCLLNGDLGGSLPASIDFGVEQYYDVETNTTTFTKIPIYKIIREAVHAYAGEPYHNIVINDLDEAAVELLEYRGDVPLYMLRNVNQDEFVNYTINGDTQCYLESDIDYTTPIALKDIKVYDPRLSIAPELDVEPTRIHFDNPTVHNDIFTVAKLEYGQAAGYRHTELTYAGDLISNIGESITSILDKIKNMLGNYEYFYNLEGQFVWQRKKTFTQTSWNNIVKVGDDQYVENAAQASSYTYYFGDGNLITSFQNSPVLNNLKNDYVVWGKRKSISGAEVPIHYRYAIDVKPTKYVKIDGTIYSEEEYDWREIIYQMADDYYKHGTENDFLSSVAAANKGQAADGGDLYPSGITGYEQYYVDMFSFWRELYNPNPQVQFTDFEINDIDSPNDNVFEANEDLYVKGTYTRISEIGDYSLEDLYIFRDDLGWGGMMLNLIDGYPLPDYYASFDDVSSNKYYLNNGENAPLAIPTSRQDSIMKTEIRVNDGGDSYIPLTHIIRDNINEYPVYYYNPEGYYKVKDIRDNNVKSLYYYSVMGWYFKNTGYYMLKIDGSKANDQVILNPIIYNVANYDYVQPDSEEFDQLYWNKSILDSPTSLNFWFDFLDTEGELSQFAVKNVGIRTKAVNDNLVKSIYYREVPKVVFRTPGNNYDVSGYTTVQLGGDLENLFSISAQGKSAKDAVDEMLFNYSYCIENVTISAIPIYYLQPNTRIYVKDDASKINGEYIVSKMTIPLAYNGTMSITASKAPNKIY